jgi:predicted Zn-dependent protease
MASDDHSPWSTRRGVGLVIIDEAQNRADAIALQRSGRLLASGQTGAAMAALDGLAATPTTTVRAHAATILATLLVEAGQAAEALTVLEAIPARGVTVDRGLLAMVRAQALRHVGRHADAVAAAAEAWAAASTSERCLVYAAALLAAGRPDRAAAVLAEGLESTPDDVELLGQRAGALALAGDVTMGREVLQHLARHRVDDDPAWWRQWAWASTCLGDVAAGQAALDTAFALDPVCTRAWCADDDVLARRGVRVRECGDGPT